MQPQANPSAIAEAELERWWGSRTPILGVIAVGMLIFGLFGFLAWPSTLVVVIVSWMLCCCCREPPTKNQRARPMAWTIVMCSICGVFLLFGCIAIFATAEFEDGEGAGLVIFVNVVHMLYFCCSGVLALTMAKKSLPGTDASPSAPANMIAAQGQVVGVPIQATVAGSPTPIPLQATVVGSPTPVPVQATVVGSPTPIPVQATVVGSPTPIPIQATVVGSPTPPPCAAPETQQQASGSTGQPSAAASTGEDNNAMDEENNIMEFHPSEDYVEMTVDEAKTLAQSVRDNPSLAMDSERCAHLVQAVRGRPMRCIALQELALTLKMDSEKANFLSASELVILDPDALDNTMRGPLRLFPGSRERVLAARRSS